MDEAGRESPGRGHTLQDHLLGLDAEHAHDGDADHDHDHFAQAGLLQPGMPEHVALTSIGIDIGSSGTQVAFSRLHMQELGEGFAARFVAGTREVLYRSPVSFTPYGSDGRIAARRVLAIVDDAFTASGLEPDRIDTGVVLLTGEALRRENAEPLGRVLADRCGDIVSAAAGHHLEAALAAFGSGAAQASHANAARILNIDIGGGTTKFAVVENGRVTATSAIAVGGRLIVVDDAGRAARLEPPAQVLATGLGLTVTTSDTISDAALDDLAQAMAEAVVSEVRQPGSAPAALQLTEPLPAGRTYDAVMMSGGVAEYVYGRETRDFSDLGRRLGEALAARITAGALPAPLLAAKECIRATVVGASEYAVQLSGRTGFMTSPRILPKRGIMVIAPPLPLPDLPSREAVAATITAHRKALGVGCDSDVALAVAWRGEPSHTRVSALAQGIAAAFADRIAEDLPLIILVDADIARTLGAILTEEVGVHTAVLVLDGVEVSDFDYVDLARLRLPSETVPVTVTSLAFRYDWRHEEALRRTALRAAHGHDHHDHDHRDHHHDHGHGGWHSHTHDHGSGSDR